MTIKEALNWSTQRLQKIIDSEVAQTRGAEIGSAFLDSEVLLADALKKDRVYLLAHQGKSLTPLQKKKFETYVRQRIKRMPVAYIAGMKEFYGLTFNVNRNVLIPRPETELLVDTVLKEINYKLQTINYKLIDVGTGSGCIAIALAKNLPNKASILASDISSKALSTAKKNAQRNGVANRIHFVNSDLLTQISTSYKLSARGGPASSGQATSSIFVANLPYLSYKQYFEAKKQYPELAYEPKSALVAKENGLREIKQLLFQIKKYHIKHAILFLEIDPSQAKPLKALAKKILGDSRCVFQRDLSGRIRIAKVSL
ncbi:peptide chain release factor N(5)-glutamine methyltransferase [Candidatus Uhrbacteria bacterium]|nr:peptide chain release factor N(5)-glutamine methyltransferase [Candidatus Uhrbacteria bacterium]